LYTSTNTYITLLATIKKFKQKKALPTAAGSGQEGEKTGRNQRFTGRNIRETAKTGAGGSYARPATKSGQNTPISAREMAGAAGTGTGARAPPRKSLLPVGNRLHERGNRWDPVGNRRETRREQLGCGRTGGGEMGRVDGCSGRANG